MLHEIDSPEFAQYLDDLGKNQKPLRHDFYDESIDLACRMGVHMTGDNPKKLLDIKRPNEDPEALKYRLDSYKPKTKSAANRAVSIINRIYNPRLYTIEYNQNIKIADQDESLKKYLEGGMPLYKTLINYVKSVFTKMHLKDPGGVVAIQPADYELEDTNFFEPIPFFYSSKQVLDFQDGEYYTIGFFKEVTNYQKEFLYKVAIYDKNSVRIFVRENYGEDFELYFEYIHGFDYVPAFRAGGVVANPESPVLYESFIAGVLPHWDDAVCWYSDLAAQIVNHIYPEKWEYSRTCSAKNCRDGKVLVSEVGTSKKLEIDCKNCHGTGREVIRSPFNVIQINRSAMNPDEQLPIPPGGYIQKDLDPTKMLELIAEAEIKKGFEAVNLDYISTNENQSGIAKMIDRQDQDGFLSTYATHIFNWVLPNMIKGIIYWRYYALIPSKERIEEFMPSLKEPTTFDIYSVALLTEELSTLKQSGVSGAVLLGLQKDIIEKRFPDRKIKQFLQTVLDIDPLAPLSDDEIMANQSVIGRTEQYIHAYAKSLVEEAVDADEMFLDKPLSERKEIIFNLANSKLPEEIEVEPIEDGGQDT